MKKIISILLTLCLIFSITPLVFSSEIQNSTETMLKQIKERIGDTSKYEDFNSSCSEYDGKTTYDFYWSTRKNDRYESFSLSCDSSGIITSYYKSYSAYNDKPSINKIPTDEALKKATELVKNLNPSIADKLYLEHSNNSYELFSNGFSFRIIRKENGIPVKNQGGQITVNENADEIVNFYISYDPDISFLPAENLINKDEAIKSYTENLGLTAEYRSNYKDKELTIVPCYVEKDSNYNKYINAQTGEIYELNFEDSLRKEESTNDSAAGAENLTSSMLSDAEIKELDQMENLLDKNEIISILKKTSLIAPPSGYEISNFSTYKNSYDNKYSSRISYRKEDKNGYFGNISYNIDAETGDINSYSFSEYNNNESKITINKQRAYDLLNNAVKSLGKKVVEEYTETDFYYPETKNNYENTANITLTREVNGLLYRNDYISASINLQNGKLIRFNKSYTDKEFPSVDNLISKDVATETLFKNIDYDICYIINGKTATPVYMFSDKKPIIIDSINNVMLNYSLEEEKEQTKEYSDINNHYAKDIINRLLEYNIGFEGDEFKPDTNIIQKDFISFLTSVFFQENNLYDDILYKRAVQNEIIKEDEINPDSYVTRGDAAKFIIRALGLSMVADLENIYSPVFNDVTENIGSVNILYGLGLIKGDGKGNYNPKTPITRAETAVIIYNYLTK